MISSTLPNLPSSNLPTNPTDSSSIRTTPDANGTINPGDREFGPQSKVISEHDPSYFTPPKITF
jgi:hypothetical protein